MSVRRAARRRRAGVQHAYGSVVPGRIDDRIRAEHARSRHADQHIDLLLLDVIHRDAGELAGAMSDRLLAARPGIGAEALDAYASLGALPHKRAHQ